MSIYDSIGGAPAIRAAVDDFYARVLADARLAPFFTGTDLHRLKAHQRAFIAAAVGGPEVFAGRDMACAHAGLGIEDGDFDGVKGPAGNGLSSGGSAAARQHGAGERGAPAGSGRHSPR